MLIKTAILVAVSSDTQAADDKASIPHQIETCRKFIQANNGIETAVYTLDGFSRFGYYDLTKAMEDIPPLNDCLTAAAHASFDGILLDNLDRLGSLGMMMFNYLSRLRPPVQIRSARQTGWFGDPETYNPHQDEAVQMAMHMSGIITTYRYPKIQRALEVGIEKRIQDGKYSRSYPKLGYTKNEDGTLSIDPITSIPLITAKDLFLSGATTKEIAAILNGQKWKAPKGGKWNYSTVNYVLKNPFYAGKVFKDRWINSRQWRTKNGKVARKSTINPKAEFLDGSHAPLWSWEEYQQIMDAFQERYHDLPRHNPRIFSSLMFCDVCKKPMSHNGNWRCHGRAHGVNFTEDEFIDIFCAQAVPALMSVEETLPHQIQNNAEEKIRELEKKIDRVTEGFENGLYRNPIEARQKVDDYKSKMANIRQEAANAERQRDTMQRILSQRDELLGVLQRLPDMLRNRTPEENNRFLRRIIKRIHISQDKTIKIDWR